MQPVDVAGWAGANLCDLLIFPMDTIKSRQQTGVSVIPASLRPPLPPPLPPSGAGAHAPPMGGNPHVQARLGQPSAPSLRLHNLRFPSSLATQWAFAKRSTAVVRSLYDGLAANQLGAGLACGVFVVVYEYAKHEMEERRRRTGSAVTSSSSLAVEHMTAASVAAVACSFVQVPAENVKQRLQVGMSPTNWHAIRTVYTSYGLRGFYTGFGALVMRELPFDAIEFAAYEFLKTSYSSVLGVDPNDDSLSVGGKVGIVMGGIAGALAGGVTTPVDRVKTTLMTQSAPAGSPAFYRNSWQCAKGIYAKEGIQAFSKGLGPRVIWSAFGGSVFFSCLEISKTLVRDLLQPP